MTDRQVLQTSYDRVAAVYTARIADELAAKPLDRALLDCFAEQVGTQGVVYDLGCGPGHVGAYLAQTGLRVEGIDLSAGMIAQAQQRYPAIAFTQGDLRSLAAAEDTVSGIVAFYSIIHLHDQEIVVTFQEWWRVLRPGGRVLLAFHVGDTIEHYTTLWDHPVDLDFHYLQPDTIAAALQQAGFDVEAIVRRAAYPDVEYHSNRAYLLARKVS